ncbi:hypothetical protein N656DRAFT_562569 [Canariomyces notabilis]|uniref:Uncharacterized protein n=1 Tax=Canariomyces notabilis TaxID=2074819 RepID=A0AAN6QF34_9PEZI|nr:hypothetical protein N656DRAFT_562569 [Canariomyces arenarius]
MHMSSCSLSSKEPIQIVKRICPFGPFFHPTICLPFSLTPTLPFKFLTLSALFVFGTVLCKHT